MKTKILKKFFGKLQDDLNTVMWILYLINQKAVVIKLNNIKFRIEMNDITKNVSYSEIENNILFIEGDMFLFIIFENN